MASPAVVFASNLAGQGMSASTQYAGIGGYLQFSTTETNAQTKAPVAVTASKWGINISANNVSVSGAWTVRVAGAGVTETIPLVSAGTGWIFDSSHSDSISAGALIDSQCVANTGGITSQATQITFVAAGSTPVFYVCGGSGNQIAMGAAMYFPLVGFPSGAGSNTTEANCYQKQRAAGTLSLLSLTVTSVSGTGHQANFRNNGSAKNQTVTGFSTTGVIQDLSHTDSIAAGDVCSTSTNASTACSWGLITYLLAPSGTPTQELGTNFNGSATGTSSTGYVAFGGIYNSAGTESLSQFYAQKAATASNMRYYNTATTLCSLAVTFRIGAADKNQAISEVISTVAGWQEDVSHTDSIAAGNLYNSKWVSGAGSGSTLGAHMVSLALPSIAAKGGFFRSFP